MTRLRRKDLHAAFAPHTKAAHRYVNQYLVGVKPNPAPTGMVVSHTVGDGPQAGVIEWHGYTLEMSACRRPRVVCNVPTPFSLYTFMYCLKRDGKPRAYGSTLPEFLTHAMRVIEADRLAEING